MKNNYLTDQEFSELIYSHLEQQRRNSLNFLEVLFGKKSADEVLETAKPAA